MVKHSLRSPLRLRFAALTHVGRVRQRNEDSLSIGGWVSSDASMRQPYVGELSLSSGTVLTVADGIGGAPCGDRASRFVAARVPALLSNRSPQEADIVRVFQTVNEELHSLMDNTPECRTMGTTVVVAWLQDTSMVVGSIGDSRFYRLDGGEAHQITFDHAPPGPHPKDAPASSRSHLITQALGGRWSVSPLTPDVHLLDMQPWDTFLLCSDGLTNMLRPNELNEVIQSRFIGPLEDLAERLVERALEEGGYDNVSLIVGRVEPADEGADAFSSPV